MGREVRDRKDILCARLLWTSSETLLLKRDKGTSSSVRYKVWRWRTVKPTWESFLWYLLNLSSIP